VSIDYIGSCSLCQVSIVLHRFLIANICLHNCCFSSEKALRDLQVWVKNASVFWQSMDTSSDQIFNSPMRVFTKLFLFGLCLSCFFLTAIPLLPWLQLDAKRARPLLVRLVALYAWLAMRVLGLRSKIEGREDLWQKRGGQLIVANHMSYVDVLLIASSRPCCFVTSVEVRETPILGWIVQLAGCLFVERRSKAKLGNEVMEIEEALRSGLDVVVFPEATSTAGNEVIRFRRPLFNAAIRAQVAVLPVTVNYQSIDRKPVTLENRDVICWYGDMTFFSHLVKLTHIKEAQLSIYVHERIVEPMEGQELAAIAHQMVSQKFRSFSYSV
jgi:1-acyl-sn-glycerol-3-phosphate acyltransferase